MIADGNYGILSDEFKITLKQIQYGTNYIQALDELSKRVDIEIFTKIINQITRTLKNGGNLADILNTMANENSEESYLVVNRDNNDDFLDRILNLGEFYNQDSVYYKAKGDTRGSLIGTNNCEFPGYHQKCEESQLPTNTALSYMSSVGNQAFCYCRKDMGISNMMEAVGFWRNIIAGGMMVKEEIHPLTRKCMYESLRARNAIK